MTEEHTEQEVINTEKPLNDLDQEINIGKFMLSKFTDIFLNSFTIDGKTLVDWEKDFAIHFDPNMSISECRTAVATLVKLYQLASNYKSRYQAMLYANRSTENNQQGQLYKTFMRQVERKDGSRKALTNRAHCEKLAKSEVAVLTTTTMAIEIAYEFWSNVLKKLEYAQKALNIAAILNGTERKLNQY